MSKLTSHELKPIEVAKFYDFPLEYTGKGEKIGIIALTEGKTKGIIDIEKTKQDFLNDLKQLGVDFKGTLNIIDKNENLAGTSAFPTVEETLDFQVIASICPEAEITIFICSTYGSSYFMDIVKNYNLGVMSMSYGKPEFFKKVEISNKKWMKDWSELRGIFELGFEEAKNRGITVCTATGDNLASDNYDSKFSLAVDYPASSPLVLACGGTDFESDNDDSEKVWNTGGKGTGGGISNAFDLPEWQKDFIQNLPTMNITDKKSGRTIPDVAGLAGKIWKIVHKGKSYTQNGTSAVAPMWAAFITMVNQKLVRDGKPRIGFANEKIYKAFSNETFNSNILGNNAWSSNSMGYIGRNGYDACTGLGTPKGRALFKKLTNVRPVFAQYLEIFTTDFLIGFLHDANQTKHLIFTNRLYLKTFNYIDNHLKPHKNYKLPGDQCFNIDIQKLDKGSFRIAYIAFDDNDKYKLYISDPFNIDTLYKEGFKPNSIKNYDLLKTHNKDIFKLRGTKVIDNKVYFLEGKLGKNNLESNNIYSFSIYKPKDDFSLIKNISMDNGFDMKVESCTYTETDKGVESYALLWPKNGVYMYGCYAINIGEDMGYTTLDFYKDHKPDNSSIELFFCKNSKRVLVIGQKGVHSIFPLYKFEKKDVKHIYDQPISFVHYQMNYQDGCLIVAKRKNDHKDICLYISNNKLMQEWIL